MGDVIFTQDGNETRIHIKLSVLKKQGYLVGEDLEAKDSLLL